MENDNQEEKIELSEKASGHINVKLEKFEGPFDLLYHLIKKNEIDIYDIPINLLTEQYLASIKDEEVIDMDNMSEFVLMATTLLEIKSRMLLPKKNEETDELVDAREELANKLIEYQYFKAVSEIMGEQFQKPIITREKEEELFKNFQLEIKNIPETEEILDGVTLEKLYDLFKQVVLRQENKVDKVRSSYGKIKKETYTIEEKKDYIRSLLVNFKVVNFLDIFDDDITKPEKIATFLAVLELIKIREICVEQEKNFDDIVIKSTGEVQNEL